MTDMSDVIWSRFEAKVGKTQAERILLIGAYLQKIEDHIKIMSLEFDLSRSSIISALNEIEDFQTEGYVV